MKRYYLVQGDVSVDGDVIIEGTTDHLIENKPAALVHMATRCNRCQGTGNIRAKGFRKGAKYHGTFVNANKVPYDGEAYALSGDISHCFTCHKESVFNVQRSVWTEVSDCDIYLSGMDQYIQPPGDLFRPRNEVKDTAPVSVVSRSFLPMSEDEDGALRPAEATYRRQVTVNGQPIDIYQPVNTSLPEGYSFITSDQIVEWLKIVPVQQYSPLRTIELTPYISDSYLENNLAAIGNPSIISIAPWSSFHPSTQPYIDRTLLHESGHVWQHELLRYYPDLWERYAKAIAEDTQLAKDAESDVSTVSGYAVESVSNSNYQEDFAESSVMYWSSLGSRCEGTARRNFPTRYAFFDKLVKMRQSGYATGFD